MYLTTSSTSTCAVPPICSTAFLDGSQCLSTWSGPSSVGRTNGLIGLTTYIVAMTVGLPANQPTPQSFRAVTVQVQEFAAQDEGGDGALDWSLMAAMRRDVTSVMTTASMISRL